MVCVLTKYRCLAHHILQILYPIVPEAPRKCVLGMSFGVNSKYYPASNSELVLKIRILSIVWLLDRVGILLDEMHPIVHNETTLYQLV